MATRRQHHRRLRYEPLESRRLLAITVNTLLDAAEPPNFYDMTLRRAIALAQEGEVIDFSVVGEIRLTEGELRIDKSLSINGPFTSSNGSSTGAPLISIVSPSGRVFNIDDGASGQRDVALLRLTLQGAAPLGDGGAIYNAENLRLQESVVSGSAAQRGGALFHESGDLVIADTTISDNTASQGGGLYVNQGDASVEYSVIHGNVATANFRSGGGIYNAAAALTVLSSTLDGNDAPAGDGGGVINAAGQLDLFDSTVSGNTARDSGGGVYNVAGAVVVRSSTISGNVASDSGGGLYNWNAGAGSVSIAFSTVTNNAALRGAGVAANASLGAGRLYLQASIVAGNQGDDVVAVGLYRAAGEYFQSGGYNLIGAGNAAASFANSDLANIADPGLEPLAMNGGPTATHALRPGSPAIDAIQAQPNAPPFDQRGLYHYRGEGAGFDIGAFEVQQQGGPITAAAPRPGDFDGDGLVDQRDLWSRIDGFMDRFGADLSGGDFLAWQRGFGLQSASAQSMGFNELALPAVAGEPGDFEPSSAPPVDRAKLAGLAAPGSAEKHGPSVFRRRAEAQAPTHSFAQAASRAALRPAPTSAQQAAPCQLGTPAEAAPLPGSHSASLGRLLESSPLGRSGLSEHPDGQSY